jgi:hypothetical protein
MAELDIPLGELFHLCYGKPKGLCVVRHCRNSRREHGRLCGTHHMAAWRKRNPMKAAWSTLKYHAKARKLPFTITFDQFKEICEATGYMERKGQRPEDLALDRIKNWKGYTLENVRVITVAVNGSKGYHEGRLKLSSGQEVLWDEIGIDESLRRGEDRLTQYNPWQPKKPTHESNSNSEEELPAWITKESNDPF